MTQQENIDSGFGQVAADVNALLSKIDELSRFVFPIGGRFLLDPNEFNAWGIQGPYDDTNSQDLGDVGDTTPARVAGGVTFPYDVEIINFHAYHRNNNGGALPWGWRIFKQTKLATPGAGSSDVTAVDVLNQINENGGTPPNDYGNTITQKTEIDFTNVTLTAGEILVLGVESPTAIATNNYVEIFSGFIQFKRILS